jgi:hypothetical protein
MERAAQPFAMNIEKILQVVIGVAVVAGVIFMIRCYNQNQKAEKERLKQEVVDRLGEVDINPRTTFAELKRAFGAEPEMKRSGVNAVAALYGSDYGIPLVEFTFYETDNTIESVTDNDLPVRIQIEHPFRGSICGVHVQDTLETAETNIRRCFRLVKVKPVQHEGWALELDASFSLSKYGDGDSDYLYFADKAIETKIQVVPNFGTSEK